MLLRIRSKSPLGGGGARKGGGGIAASEGRVVGVKGVDGGRV